MDAWPAYSKKRVLSVKVTRTVRSCAFPCQPEPDACLRHKISIGGIMVEVVAADLLVLHCLFLIFD